MACRRHRSATSSQSLLRFTRGSRRPPTRSVPESLGSLPAHGGANAMNIRPATANDEQALRELCRRRFQAEVTRARGLAARDLGARSGRSSQAGVAAGSVFVAEDADGAAGMLEARAAEPGRWHVETIHVRERARRQGAAKALLHACSAAGQEAPGRLTFRSACSSRTRWRRRCGSGSGSSRSSSCWRRSWTRSTSGSGTPRRARRTARSTRERTIEVSGRPRRWRRSSPPRRSGCPRAKTGGWIRIVARAARLDRDAQMKLSPRTFRSR